MLRLHAAARVERKLHTQRRTVDPGVDDVHVNAVLRLGDLHIEYHIRPVKLRALRVVHFPPVAGLRLFFKRQIIPARHGLVQRIGVFARGGQRLGDEAAVLTETGADVHTHSKIAVLEI